MYLFLLCKGKRSLEWMKCMTRSQSRQRIKRAISFSLNFSNLSLSIHVLFSFLNHHCSLLFFLMFFFILVNYCFQVSFNLIVCVATITQHTMTELLYIKRALALGWCSFTSMIACRSSYVNESSLFDPGGKSGFSSNSLASIRYSRYRSWNCRRRETGHGSQPLPGKHLNRLDVFWCHCSGTDEGNIKNTLDWSRMIVKFS